MIFLDLTRIVCALEALLHAKDFACICACYIFLHLPVTFCWSLLLYLSCLWRFLIWQVLKKYLLSFRATKNTVRLSIFMIINEPLVEPKSIWTSAVCQPIKSIDNMKGCATPEPWKVWTRHGFMINGIATKQIWLIWWYILWQQFL